MRRLCALLLAAALALGLAACVRDEDPAPVSSGPEEPSPSRTERTAQELAELVFPYSGCERPENVERLTGGEDLAFYLENAYGLEAGAWEDAAVIRGVGASAFELAVLRLGDEAAAGRAAEKLTDYIPARQADFAGYAPAQAELVSGGSIVRQGSYAALLICPETGLAGAAFTAAVEGTALPDLETPPPSGSPSETPSEAPSETLPDSPSEAPSETSPEAPSETPSEVPTETPSELPSESPTETPSESLTETPSETPPETPSEAPAPSETPDWSGRYPFDPPNEDDMSVYDTGAILDAWESGDASELSDYDRAVYDAAEKVLEAELKEGMSDYEKERALYKWLVNHVDYDWRHQDVMVETPRESFTPYGGLVNHTAVCLGYATSFQLLMDMAGVECITVVGAAFESTGDHAWNMVRLHGDWYCVDVTWDANGREQLGFFYRWRYFNITSDKMADQHQWDYGSVPEATAQDGGK